MNTLVDGVTYHVADVGADADGLYHGDTRHLSPLSVDVGGVDLTLVGEDRRPPWRRVRRYANVATAVNEISESVVTKHATVLLTRSQSVSEGRLVETVALRNHHPREQTFQVDLRFGADFADVFEVRGLQDAADRDVRAEVGRRAVRYAYDFEEGDGAERTLETAVSFEATPDLLEVGRASYGFTLGPQERRRIALAAVPGGDESTVRAGRADGVDPSPAAVALDAGEVGGAVSGGVSEGDGSVGDDAGEVGGVSAGDAGETPVRVDPFVSTDPIATGDPAYDRTFAQAARDLRALTTATDSGPVPLAGAPWFVTVFGRDALLASYLLVPFAPSLARGTLRFLAARQGSRRDERRDEAAGKILHEVRNGELARTESIPQLPYYGTVDATPLWVTLLHETWRWTGDDDLVADLWGSLRDVLDRLDRAVAAVNGEDPFLYYETLGAGGVTHKVWRDSANGVQYADGREASPPLASAAVQGYLADALERAADLAAAVGDDDELAARLAGRADRVAAEFDDAFWMPERGFYAAALTADGRQVDSVTSNVGHCLWSGVVPARRAEAVTNRLLDPDLFSGWGLRTLSADDAGYSPISYHAGGVWPHDNALAALGLARYGRHEAVDRVATGQLDAFSRFESHSAPELFCGFDGGTPPVAYPSACRPQAWSAAAPFGFLRALFALEPDADGGAWVARRPDAMADDCLEDVLAHWR